HLAGSGSHNIRSRWVQAPALLFLPNITRIVIKSANETLGIFIFPDLDPELLSSEHATSAFVFSDSDTMSQSTEDTLVLSPFPSDPFDICSLLPVAPSVIIMFAFVPANMAKGSVFTAERSSSLIFEYSSKWSEYIEKSTLLPTFTQEIQYLMFSFPI
ncbi:hypothetical protein Tco_0029159, partial [Tanacetum coccineum]